MSFCALTKVIMLKPILSPVKALRTNSNKLIRYKSSFPPEPSVPFFEKPSYIFSLGQICHHFGVIPILVITLAGFTCEMLYTLRQALTRDDVQYTRSPPACDVIETRQGYPAPIRKFRVYNQKYVVPQGLLDAKMGKEPADEDEKSKNSISPVKTAALCAGVSAGHALIGFML